MQPAVETIGDDSEMKTPKANEETSFIDVERYRGLVHTFIGLRRYKTALFWAEKACVLSENQGKDIYWLAQCMFLLHEYHRAAHIIKLHGLEKTNIFCLHLIAECYYEAKEYTEAMDLLNSIDLEYLSNTLINTSDANESIAVGDSILQILATVDADDIGPSKSEVLSAIYLLKGKILEAMENRNMAMNGYIESLHLNVYCVEALDALIQHEMLLASEERELIAHLPFDTQCTDSERKIIEKLYKSKLKKYNETISANQTSASNFDSIGTIKVILDVIEKTKTERSNTEFKVGSKEASAKIFSNVQQTARTQSPSKFSAPDSKAASLYSRLSRHETDSPINISSIHMSKTHLSNPIGRNACNTTGVKTKQLIPLEESCNRLNQSIDVSTELAGSLFYNSEYKNCITLLDELLKVDPYHSPALIILIGCLVELKEYSKLFSVAHKLVDLYSDQAISWYAVGCYYDLIGKSDPARRYLTKATSIDRLFGPAWLAYGHSFAKENEHDQAMAAYFKATQLMRGCHLPLLYIGVECGLTKNYELSQKFFYQAMSIAPLDVFVLHELGVIKFEYERFEEAEEILRITLEMVTKISLSNNEPISVRWEPLINNLGHCCRKNKKYDESLKYHKQALGLKALNSSTFTAIGFVYALKGQLDRAVNYLHRSLALKRDDIVATALLKSCLEDLMAEDGLPKSLLNDDKMNEDVLPGGPKKPNFKPNFLSEERTELKATKINFDDESNDSEDSTHVRLDMSMDF